MTADTARNAATKVGRWIALIAVGVIALLALLAALAALPAARGGNDDIASVTVRNGLQRTAVVGLCRNAACSAAVYSKRLRPGESFLQNLGRDSAQPFRITTPTGRLLGCWLLPPRSRRGNYTVWISTTKPCSSLW